MSYTRNYGQPCKKYCEVRKKYSGFGRIVIGMYLEIQEKIFLGYPLLQLGTLCKGFIYEVVTIERAES
jgi:hypothetical protein